MQSGRTKSAMAIQQSLDGKQDVKRLMKEFSASVSRHTSNQHINLALKNQQFEEFEIPVFKPAA